jgi:hypothetical protein
MAIEKTKTLPSGVSGNFWVMNRIQIAPDYSFIRCFANLYTSQGAFVSGVPSIFEEDVIVTSNPVTPAAIEYLLELYLVGQTSFTDFYGGSVV